MRKTKRKTMYKQLDKLLKKLVLIIYRNFLRVRTLPFDEINVAPKIQEFYEELVEENRKVYKEIATWYYNHEGQRGDFPDDLLLELLRTPSPVMKYSYDSEVIRKRDRLVEALLATGGDVNEIDKGMRYWTQMTGWFAVEVADFAVAQARAERSVSRVRWRSERDNKVCHVCFKRDGNIYPLAAVPPKPHPNCRCWTEVVR
jgi:hypothetical protein